MALATILLALVAISLGAFASLGSAHQPEPVHAPIAAADDPEFVRTLELYTRTRITPGNAVTLMLNGNGTLPDLWRDLRAARHSIAIQQYFALPGAVTDTLATILMERARAGVRVRVLLDAEGAKGLGTTWWNNLRASGVTAVLLRPPGWATLYRAGNRSHIRAVIVDDSVAYTGGVGFGDMWLGDGRSEAHWRETNARVTGPVVGQFQALFANIWFDATGELLAGAGLAEPLPADSGKHLARAGLFYTTARAAGGSTNASVFLELAIGSARRRLYIANSYFIPDAVLRGSLIRAAARGVDVRVLTAGPSTDVRAVHFAARYAYGELLRGGVRIYEYEPTMMHAKTLAIDDAWSSVGSMNLDNRSIAFNDEADLVILDRPFAAIMDAAFVDDLQFAHELTLAEFDHRGWVTRVGEWFATFASRML